MKSLFKFSVLAFSLLFTTMVFAQYEKKFVLKYYGERFTQNSVLKLKQDLRSQHGINVNRWRIDRVRLVAKSRQGNGRAKLVVGPYDTRWRRIDGGPREFRLDQPRTWDKITFQNPARRSQGNWQIHMRGNVKVKRVVVFLERERGWRPPPRPFPNRPWRRPYPRPRPRPRPRPWR